MTSTCPACAAETTGRFCPQCGVALNATCRDCQNPLPAGARFCNQCGVPVAASAVADVPVRRQPVAAWAVAGAAVVVAAAAILVPVFRGGQAPPAATAAASLAPAGPAAGDPSQVDVANMPPREAADRLFNRAMQTATAADTAQLGFFTGMAIQAYGRVPERDADLHYHLGELYRLQGDAAAVRAQADSILAGDPEHLFGLVMAGRAEQMRGNAEASREAYRRFLGVYTAQVARNLREYQDHAQALPSLRGEAEQAVR
ncbi:MAG TPA: zinc ribbon domain-containing protein [Longimicrobium sp.]|nr:zinc ribbon domain-containing protein [Longimicrobium sp.]